MNSLYIFSDSDHYVSTVFQSKDHLLKFINKLMDINSRNGESCKYLEEAVHNINNDDYTNFSYQIWISKVDLNVGTSLYDCYT